MGSVDLTRLQSWVLPGLPSAQQELLFCDLTDVGDPRALLRGVRLTRASEARTETVECALGVSADLCRRLGVTEQMGFADQAFLTGMPKRRAKLGDPDPKDWFVGGPTAPVHAVVVLAATDANPPVLEPARELEARIREAGGRVRSLRAGTFDGTREHFGFADGVSQPHVGDAPPTSELRRSSRPSIRQSDGQPVINPGEFIFGYVGEPVLGDPDVIVNVGNGPVAQQGSESTHSVVRILEQDVARFHDFCEKRAKKHGVDRAWLQSRIVGRWPSGAAIEQHPDSDPGPTFVSNAFDFGRGSSGACPIGAHIRKVNPRNAVEDDAINRRRLLRRGIPYGKAFPDSDRESGAGERGLAFVAHMTSIEQHFEFVMNSWVRSASRPLPHSGIDLLVAPDAGRTLSLKRPDGTPFAITANEPFVTCRGGGYFWTPPIDEAGQAFLPTGG